MSNPASPNCPQCGAVLPAGAPGGLCPRCLMALNLQTETVFTDDTPAAQPPLPPEQIAPHFPQLEILECLGRGGMGVVYKARQKTLNRFVALKLLAPERVNDAKFAERFTREAQALAALNHPNIVTIHDFGQAGGFYFLLMEFVDGVNLRQLLRTRKFTPEEALAIVPPLCDALQFAHERGIVHRDIKPENLLLDKTGRVKVADFGIAKILGHRNGDLAGTVTGPDNATKTALGTPGYSAPEQKTDPSRVDSRADIYSLGVVFYEMLTGELPGQRIEPPSRKVQIDVRLDHVVLRALEKTPELRFQQASEVKTCVETIATTPLESESRKGESANLAGQSPPCSGTALLGAGLIAPFLFSIFFWDFGRKGGTAALVGCTIASLGFIALMGTTFLGWIALGQIRRSHGRLRGLPLAMLESLLLPVLLVDTAIIFLLLLTNKLVNVCLLSASFPVLRDSAFVNPTHYLLWLLVTAAVVIGVDYAIINRLWRRTARPFTPGPATPTKPDHFWRWFALGLLGLAMIPVVLIVVALIAPALTNARDRARQSQLDAHSGLTFGPVSERTLTNEMSIAFASGRVAAGLPDSVKNSGPAANVLAAAAWMQQQGLDALWTESEGLLNVGMQFKLLKDGRDGGWDQAPSLQTYRALALAGPDAASQVSLHAPLNGTDTFAFKTRAGAMGMLQITALNGGPPGVNLRYKMLIPPVRPAPALALPPSAPLPWTNWNNHQEIGSFYAVAATPTETVAVGIDGRIATRDSATGNWHVQIFAGDPDFRGILFAHGQYIVVREQGSIMTSRDGLTWTPRNSPVTNNLLGAFWDGHQYLVGGDLGTLLTSPDGVIWSQRDSGSEVDLSGFAYSGARYVAVGNDGIIISDDALTWRKPVTWAETARVPLIACTWTGGEFLACGLGLDKLPTIYTSPDGETWTLRDSTITASLRAAITVNGVIYVAGDSVIARSTDGGATWVNTFAAPNANPIFMGLAWDGRNVIATGFNNNVWALPAAASTNPETKPAK